MDRRSLGGERFYRFVVQSLKTRPTRSPFNGRVSFNRYVGRWLTIPLFKYASSLLTSLQSPFSLLPPRVPVRDSIKRSSQRFAETIFSVPPPHFDRRGKRIYRSLDPSIEYTLDVYNFFWCIMILPSPSLSSRVESLHSRDSLLRRRVHRPRVITRTSARMQIVLVRCRCVWCNDGFHPRVCTYGSIGVPGAFSGRDRADARAVGYTRVLRVSCAPRWIDR